MDFLFPLGFPPNLPWPWGGVFCVHTRGSNRPASFCCFLLLFGTKFAAAPGTGTRVGSWWGLGGQPQRGEQADPERPKDVGLEREKKKEKKEREKENGKK